MSVSRCEFAREMSRVLWAASVLVAVYIAGAGAGAGAGVARALLAGGAYSLQSTVVVNGAERRDRDLGYRLQGELRVARLPDDTHTGDLMLRFQLVGVGLMVRGVHRAAEWEARGSLWNEAGDAAWVARLHSGLLSELLLPTTDPPDVRNYKRAISSLFQFQVEGGGERNETDSSGECVVLYEPAGAASYRKIKRSCSGDEAAGVLARRVARYSLAPGGESLGELHADEVVTVREAVKLRSWHTLHRIGDGPGGAEVSVAEGGLEPARLELEDPPREYHDEHVPELGAALEAYREALGGEEAGAGGGAAEARALLDLLPSAERASQRDVARALRAADRAALPALCRVLGLAGTAAAARAVTDFLHIGAPDSPAEPLARAFFAGFSLAHRVDSVAVSHVLRLADATDDEAVAEGALLAVAAAAASGGDASRAAVRDALVKGVARCEDEGCRATRLLALGNLRAAAADLLVESAERGPARVAAAALVSLRAASDVAPPHLTRLGRLAVNVSLPLEVRAAALELVVARRAAQSALAAPLQLVELATALHAERTPLAHELRRVLWQRLRALHAAPPVRALLPLLPRRLTTWDALAHHGTSHVLRRDTGWGGGAGGWRVALDSVQVAAGGLLRRGAVSLLARPPPGGAAEERGRDGVELEVEVWSRGLQALAGAGDEAGDGEGAGGGLAITVAGARLPDVTLFDGQAELLGHVWAGTGSTPTAVVRAARRAHSRRGAVPLAGGCWARVRTEAATALALDAHVAVSLWQRTARGALGLRAALVAQAEANVRTQWARLEARRELALEPRLRVALALDFYSGVSVCVRAAIPEHAVREELRLASVAGARRLNVSRGTVWTRALPARTLSLGRANDAACRTLQADADDPDD